MGSAALVMGILQFVCLGFLGSILAIIFGKIGMNKANRGEATNGGVAKAGFILGIIGLVLWIIGLVIAGVIIAKAPKSIEGLCGVPLQVAAPNTNLEGCTVSGQDFTGKNYTGWSINRTNMSNANFSDTTWTDSDIRNSDLSGSDFTGCTLQGVNFSGSDLTGVNFSGCTFGRVSVGNAIYDKTTIFPEDFAP
ncbi:MAG: pentapeptide repeat-containing protein [Candidatus Nanopelagicales bacterium]